MRARIIATDDIIDVEKRIDRIGRIEYVYYYAQSGESFQDYELEFPPDTPNEITIEGWVAVDEVYEGEAWLHIDKPHAESREFCDTGDYEIEWVSNGKQYHLDRDLFPDMSPESKPKRVKITITPIEE